MTANDQLHEDHAEELICGNCCIQEKETPITLGFSKERVGHITSVLGFCKICARWVLHMLSDEQNTTFFLTTDFKN